MKNVDFMATAELKRKSNRKIKKLLKDGKYINAIKEARWMCDGLKEAKEYVDKVKEKMNNG